MNIDELEDDLLHPLFPSLLASTTIQLPASQPLAGHQLDPRRRKDIYWRQTKYFIITKFGYSEKVRAEVEGEELRVPLTCHITPPIFPSPLPVPLSRADTRPAGQPLKGQNPDPGESGAGVRSLSLLP